jgi:hypothetical protein
MATEDLALHHFGEAENGVQRCAQFMAHLREEARLGDIGGFGAVARFIGDGLGLFEFADQGVLLGAGFQCRERGRMQPLRQKREIAFGCDSQNGQHVVVEGAAQDEAQRDAERHWRGGGKGGNRQARGEHAGDRDHQQHQEHHQRIGDDVDAGRMHEDHRPRQAVEQVQKDKAQPPFMRAAGCRCFRQIAIAGAQDHRVNAQHAA